MKNIFLLLLFFYMSIRFPLDLLKFPSGRGEGQIRSHQAHQGNVTRAIRAPDGPLGLQQPGGFIKGKKIQDISWDFFF